MKRRYDVHERRFFGVEPQPPGKELGVQEGLRGIEHGVGVKL